ncbi:MAG: hypothetical protein IM600_13115 [Bacteroidetes bacterium]|nr:hypothetical protein [Bacteroidota bacterium]MCA6444364.1 hypothetical protein [Bacteroidota bacterium]
MIISVNGCKKKKATQPQANNPVPYIPIDFVIYPNNPTYFPIQSIGGWMYMNNVGINGIVIYRKSNEEFVVLERTSSYLPDNPYARVKVQQNNFDLKDTISGSKWRIFDGEVTEGPASWPLRRYGAAYDGNSLRIVN